MLLAPCPAPNFEGQGFPSDIHRFGYLEAPNARFSLLSLGCRGISVAAMTGRVACDFIGRACI